MKTIADSNYLSERLHRYIYIFIGAMNDCGEVDAIKYFPSEDTTITISRFDKEHVDHCIHIIIERRIKDRKIKDSHVMNLKENDVFITSCFFGKKWYEQLYK